MKRAGILCLLLLALVPVAEARRRWTPKAAGGSTPQTASDTFNYSDGAALGSQTNWSNVVGTAKIGNIVNHGFLGNSSGLTNVVRYTAGTWAANQYAQTYYTQVFYTTIQSGGIALRCNNTSGGNAYAVVYVAGSIQINIIVNGVESNGPTYTQALTNLDGLRASITGSGSGTRITITADLAHDGTFSTTVVSNADPGVYASDTGTPGVSAFSTGDQYNTLMSAWFASDL